MGHAHHSHRHAHRLTSKQHELHHSGHNHSSPHRIDGLSLALAITLFFALVEALVGWSAHSLALVSDAIHMLTDSFSLGLAALAAWLARRPPSSAHTYGYGRVEVLAAFLNAVLMLAILCGIAWQAIVRIQVPQHVNGIWVSWTAAMGLLVNLGVAWVIAKKTSENINQRAALIHVMGDTLGSVAALGSGIVIAKTGWTLIDPISSLLICVLVFTSTINLLRDSIHTLMEGVPPGYSPEKLAAAMSQVANVASVHDLHVWTLGSDKVALSAHVVLKEPSIWTETLSALHKLLAEEFLVDHATLQPEVVFATTLRNTAEIGCTSLCKETHSS